MIAKLYNVVAMISIATVLAVGGFAGWLGVSGRLNAARLQTVAKVLRGELDQAAEPQAEPAVAESESAAPSGQSLERVRAARQRDQLHELMIERAQKDLAARQELLDQTLQNLLNEQEQVVSKPAKVSETREKPAMVDHDAGFRQELELISGLQPKQAKEHMVRMWKKQPADAVRLMSQLDPARGKRILAQFKTSEELEIMSQLLEQMRLQGVQAYAKESGTTRGAATP